MPERRVKRLRAGEETYEGNFVCFGERDIFEAGRRTDEKAHGENALRLEMLEAVFCFSGIVAVVGSDQSKLAAVDAALFVDGVEVGTGAGDSLRAQELRWSFERGTGADDNFFLGNAGNGLRRERGRKAKNNDNAEQSRGEETQRDFHFLSPELLRIG